MPLILFILGVISIVAGVAAIGTRFVDETGFDFSFAFGYQAIVGGILLIAFGRLLKHVADTDANTTRMAQAMALGSGSPSAAPMADLAVSEPVMVAPVVEPPAPEVDDRATHAHSEPAEPEAAVTEPAPAVDEAASSTPVEKIDVRGYMVDVFANGAVDVHTAEGAMRFENLAAFERELDRAAG
jgi:hypothetical protein